VSGQINNNYGGSDAWVVWLDSSGNLISNKTYGGSLFDGFQSVLRLANGDMLFTGTTESYDNDVTNNYGQMDYWVVRTDSVGTILWQKNYGGSGNDIGNKSIAPNATDFVICGYSSSVDFDVSGNYGLTDIWLVQTDTLGQLIQENHFGSSLDEGCSIYLVDSANFLLYGSSEGHDYDITVNYGSRDYWLAALQYQSVTGIATTSTTSKRIGFPIPTANEFSFSLFEEEQVKDILLYDLAGKEIGKPAGMSNGTTYTFEIDALPNGIYIASVQTSRGKFTMQIIVMH
ncbi:MAG: T9SS type A sorting domain-containing protein, partial [Bacteroidia bacterium]